MKFKVIGQLLKIVTVETIVSDSIDYLEAQFSFSADWAGTTKIAHFSCEYEDISYDVPINSSNQIVKSSNLNLSAGTWKLYVHGNTDTERITTSSVEIIVDQSGVLNGQPLPDIPLTVEEQLLYDVSVLKESAEDGTYNGATFTPHIVAGENSFTISWTNDKELTNPDPVTINITV